MSKIIAQAIQRARRLVIDRIPYAIPVDYNCNGVAHDNVIDIGSQYVHEELIIETIGDAPIVSDEKLIELIEDIGLYDLYSDVYWVDPVDDYIIDNQQDCAKVWEIMIDARTLLMNLKNNC